MRFLGSQQRAVDWPLNQQRRQHIHSTIDSAKLPITHVTLRRGSPHVLQLQKQSTLFSRDAAYRKQAHALLRDVARLQACGRDPKSNTFAPDKAGTAELRADVPHEGRGERLHLPSVPETLNAPARPASSKQCGRDRLEEIRGERVGMRERCIQDHATGDGQLLLAAQQQQHDAVRADALL
jgi:hypothetical protein